MASVSALQVKTGSPAPPPPGSECDELNEDVNNEDEKIKKSIEENSRTEKSKKRKLEGHMASTVTSSKLTCGGAVTKKTAYSSLSRLPTQERKNYVGGIKAGEKSNLCTPEGKEPFKHAPSNWSTTCTHTEGRFIEDKFAQNPGQPVSGCELVMKIKWKQRIPIKQGENIVGYKQDDPLDKPCGGCEKTICRAIECGLHIYMCKEDEEGKQVKQKPDFC